MGLIYLFVFLMLLLGKIYVLGINEVFEWCFFMSMWGFLFEKLIIIRFVVFCGWIVFCFGVSFLWLVFFGVLVNVDGFVDVFFI